MLTLWAVQPECLWDETLPIEVRELPEDLAALDGLLSDPELTMVFLERWRQEVIDDGPGGVERGSADDRDGDLRAVDGPQGALSVGVPVVGGGGVGLDSSASVLPDLAVGAGAGRVDGPEADQAGRGGDGERADACVDRGGDAVEAVPAAGGEDRLDGDRGGRALPDRRGAGLAWGEGRSRARASKLAALVGSEAAGAGSLAGDGPQAAGADPHDPSPLRGGEGARCWR